MKAYSISQGKVVDVPDDTQVLYNPQKQKDAYNSFTANQAYDIANQQKKDQEAKTQKEKDIFNWKESVKAGAVTLDKVPDTLQGDVYSLLTKEGYQPPKVLTADEKKRADASLATQTLMDTLEKRFTEAKGGEYTGMGAIIAGTKKNISGAIGFDDPAKVYNAEREGFGATLKSVTGDVGVMTDKDYARISKLLPSFTDSPEVAKSKFNDLRTQMAAKFGGNAGQSKYVAPEVKGGALSALFPAASEAIKQDQGKIGEAQQKFYAGGGYGNYLKDVAPVLAGEMIPSGRNLGVAAEMLPIATLGAGLIKGVGAPAGGMNPLQKVLNPKAALTQARNTAAEQAGNTISEEGKNRIIQAGEKYVQNDPRAAKVAEEFLSGLKNGNLTVKDLLDKTQIYNQAYGAAGAVKDSAQAGFFNALKQASKDVLKTEAPEVAKLTKLISYTYSVPNAIQKGGYTALKFTALGKLLGL